MVWFKKKTAKELIIMSPLVSIIIPVYNGEKFIKETLESIFEQTFQDFEIIIVDDGSIDGTRNILEQYAGKVTYIFQENSGPSRARNTAIKIAKGKYVAFLDGDDLWTPNKLELQIGYMESHPYIGMVFADMMTFNESGVIQASYLKSIKRKNFYSILLAEQHELKDPFSMLLYANFIPTGTVIIRKVCMDDIGFFDENISSVEDLDMWMRTSIFCKVGFVPCVLKKKRDHEGNISKDLYKATVSAIYVREKIRRDFPDHAARYRKGFDERLSEAYFEKGYWNFSRSNTKEARAAFMRAMAYKFNIKSIIYFLACFSPHFAVKLIRIIKNIRKQPDWKRSAPT
jgi:glycosyltransferase involved in cell wall biosynthesis